MNKNNIRDKGQSLIEVLIYTAIFGAVAASLMTIVWGITKIHFNTMANNEVDSNLRYAMNLISNKIRSASSVESATDSTLVLKMPNNTTSIFSVSAGVLYLQEGSSDPVAVISDRVVVSSLAFEKIDMAGAKGGARVTMTLNYVPKEGGPSNLKKTLISALTRSATAISFSEDIVPGQDNSYSVGSASYNWKNGYFSGDVTVDGTISGTTYCISSDCKTAWPSGGGGTVTGTGTTNKVAKWTSSTALGNSIIYDDGTKIGINTTSPGRLLDVDGSDLDDTYAFRVTSYDEKLAEFVGKNDLRGMVSIRGGAYGDYARLDMTQKDGGNGVAGGIIVGHGVGGAGPTTDGFNIYSTKTGSGTAGPITFNIDRGDGALVEKARITSSGDVGIGTTAPNYPLHIHSTDTGTDRRIQLSDATSGSATTDGLQLIKSTDQSAWLWNYENTAMHFGTNGAESLTLLSGGNVGVGTNDPGAKLEVANTADELLRLTRATATYPTKFKVGTDSAFVINSGNSDVLAIKSGKVGIGVMSPTSTLTVAGTVESTAGGFRFPDGTTQTTAASGSSAWTTSGNDIYSANSGNVGIGATSPGSKLTVDGIAEVYQNIYVRGALGTTTKQFRIHNNNSDIYLDYHGGSVYWRDNASAYKLTIEDSTGNIGIGTVSPGYKLDVVGDMNYSGALREDGVEIFSGMIAMFDSACPTGWTRFTALDGRIMRGAATYGTTGGSDTHTHGIATYNTSSGNQSANHNHSYSDTTGNASVGHTHDVSGTTGTDNPNHYHSYLKPSSGTSTNTAGVTASHTHSFSDTSSNQSVTHTHDFSGTTAGVSVDHSHAYTKSPNITDSGSTLPAYLEMVVCKKNAGADVAEWTLAKKKYEPATLVSLDSENAKTVKASDKAYDSAIAGIVSTEPGWILGREATQKVLLALSGQVPLNVSSLNGAIKIGDPITSSEVAGFGMKAIDAGPMVAKAMEDFNPDNLSQIIPCPKGTPVGVACGKIMVLINVSWYGGDRSQTLIGNLVEKVKSALASLGIWVENQIVKVKELVAEKIFSHKVRVEQLEMVDKQTNELYCTWIENGEWKKRIGECE